jgi:stage II sporulation SpoAA-like protein
MIELLPESRGNMLALRATGKLSGADYREVLAPQVRLLLKQFRTLRVLFVLDNSFAGWSIGAAWANSVLDLRHRRDFEKIAMVGAPKWEEWCVKTGAALLIRSEMRTFRLDEVNHAREWLQV